MTAARARATKERCASQVEQPSRYSSQASLVGMGKGGWEREWSCIDAELFVYETQECDDSHDISIVHKFAQLHHAFFTAMLTLCGGKSCVSTACSLWQTESSLCAFSQLHSPAAMHFKICVIISLFAVTLHHSHMLSLYHHVHVCSWNFRLLCCCKN